MLLDIIISALLFGLSPVLCKLIGFDFSPFTISGLLYLGACITSYDKNNINFDLISRFNLKIASVILFGGILGPVFLMSGLSHISALNTSLLFNLEPVFTVILAVMFFRENITLKSLIGITGIFIALTICLPFKLSYLEISGYIFIALACLCYALDNNLSSIIDNIKPNQLVFVKGFTSVVVNLFIGLNLFKDNILNINCLEYIVVGYFCYGLSLILYVKSNQKIGAIKTQLVFSLSTFFGIFFACIVFHDSINLAYIAALLLIAVSFYLIFSEKHSHKHTHTKLTHTHYHNHLDGHHSHWH